MVLSIDTIICLALLVAAVVIYQEKRHVRDPQDSQNLCVSILIATGICNYYTLGVIFAEITNNTRQPSASTYMKNVRSNYYMMAGLFIITPLWTAALLLCSVYARGLPRTKSVKDIEVLGHLGPDDISALSGWEPIILSWCLLLLNVISFPLGLLKLLCEYSHHGLLPSLIFGGELTLWIAAVMTIAFTIIRLVDINKSAKAREVGAKSGGRLDRGMVETRDDSAGEDGCDYEHGGEHVEHCQDDSSYHLAFEPDLGDANDYGSMQQYRPVGLPAFPRQPVRNAQNVRHERVVRHEQVHSRHHDNDDGLWFVASMADFAILGI